MVHIRWQTRHRQYVVTVARLASVSTSRLLQNGHTLGRTTVAPLSDPRSDVKPDGPFVTNGHTSLHLDYRAQADQICSLLHRSGPTGPISRGISPATPKNCVAPSIVVG